MDIIIISSVPSEPEPPVKPDTTEEKGADGDIATTEPTDIKPIPKRKRKLIF